MMRKLVVLKFIEGSFEHGFTVTLQVGEEGSSPTTEITGKLPAETELPLYYSHWQSNYRRLGNGYRLSADKVQVTNVSMTQDCDETAYILRSRFNAWLRSEEFRPLREKWLERLSPKDEIRVILQTPNSQLQRLPWHLWEVLERYPNAEIALASPIYDRVENPHKPNPSVNILAILGNSQGIDTQADQNLLKQLPNADVCFLVEPQRKELTDYLWQKNWDILFFAGHSSSQKDNESGQIYLNKTDSLTIEELKYALKRAVERGLQLAIFNSCDGLGLAKELADLQIPQIIVMREPVPDLVAQEFLKYFLSGFAGGESLYQAVRQARQRLQGVEDRFPCATWLPVICQNPAQIPPNWQELWNGKTGTKEQGRQERHKYFSLLSIGIAATVCGLRFMGVLQGVELQAFDQMMRSRPDEGADSRILIVTIDDADIADQRRKGESLKGTSLSDKSLNKLLEKLQQSKPRAIALDIYRDFPAEQPDLIARLKQTDNLIAVCKGSDTTKAPYGIAPPPEIPQPERLGFSDFVHDTDGVVRRHLLFMNQEAGSLCAASYSLSTQLAFRYLLTQGIQPKLTPQGDLQLGKTVFHSLESPSGGYQQGIDTNGSQILVNWRASEKIAEQVTLTQFLASPVNSNTLKDKIILIGVVAKGDYQDYWSTPYGKYLDDQMPGILVQAHLVSQILSTVLNGRPLLQVWSPWLEIIWILGCSAFGALIASKSRHSPLKLIIYLSVASVGLYITSFVLLILGYWIPFIPGTLALLGTGAISNFKSKKFTMLNLLNREDAKYAKE
jgi:CHASE2 domain-containing sensor protein